MMISILNHFSLLVVFDWWKHINMDVTLPFSVIMRSGRRNVMNHIATKWTIFGRAHMTYRCITPTPELTSQKKLEIHIWSWWRSHRSMTHGKKNPRIPDDQIWSISLQYASSWPYMDFQFFLWRQFRGWSYAPICHMGGVYPYMGAPWVFEGTKMCVTLLLIHLTQNWQTEWSWKFIYPYMVMMTLSSQYDSW
jgi:hypothetical protein